MFDIEDALKVLEDQTDRMTQWEREFIANVSDQWTHTSELTDPQVDKLEQLYGKYA